MALANQGYTFEVLESMANKYVSLEDIVNIPEEISSEKYGKSKCIRKYKNFFEFELLDSGLTVSIQLADIINLEIVKKSGFKPKKEEDIMNEIINQFRNL